MTMMNLVISLGRVIRKRRRSRGLSQEALAELAGLSRGYLGEIERGEVVASIESTSKIANALGKQCHELIREAEEEVAETDC